MDRWRKCAVVRPFLSCVDAFGCLGKVPGEASITGPSGFNFTYTLFLTNGELAATMTIFSGFKGNISFVSIKTVDKVNQCQNNHHDSWLWFPKPDRAISMWKIGRICGFKLLVFTNTTDVLLTKRILNCLGS